VNDLQVGAKHILDEAMKAKMKSEGLSKLAEKDLKNEQKKREKSEEMQFEDVLAARAGVRTGTENA